MRSRNYFVETIPTAVQVHVEVATVVVPPEHARGEALSLDLLCGAVEFTGADLKDHCRCHHRTDHHSYQRATTTIGSPHSLPATHIRRAGWCFTSLPLAVRIIGKTIHKGHAYVVCEGKTFLDHALSRLTQIPLQF